MTFEVLNETTILVELTFEEMKKHHITYENLDAIDTLIEKNLNNWKISRISKVALAALRIGITELCYVADTPDRVAINEAIELAKKYEDQKCGNFVNGILSAILKAK